MDDSIKMLVTFFLGAVTGSSWRWLFKSIQMTWKTPGIKVQVDCKL